MKLEGDVQFVGFGLMPLSEGIPHEHFLDRWLLFSSFSRNFTPAAIALQKGRAHVSREIKNALMGFMLFIRSQS